jgi:hypothetical protein
VIVDSSVLSGRYKSVDCSTGMEWGNGILEHQLFHRLYIVSYSDDEEQDDADH